ncbi:superoxide dismutase family protein [Wenzhouxiangella sp. AB-CW3]|uniref:superoxide dismutase family protein n=1 Tax=Wenzhouxiangella sp. AB-CW3 TaxID=2771012 RepID=UPI00168B4B24|nr:superoxide dismutase family protein [Wenzhouxiangella sp. AB-CW3]QOC23946.1 superoxide dismutase family protein [Wenzhouxiangella sp. AB-CW3]
MLRRILLSTLFLATAMSSSAWADPTPDAVANMINNAGEQIGTVELFSGPAGTLLRLDVRDLAPGPKAIHLHAVGTCDDHDHGFTDSGGHINPDGNEHGLLNPDGPGAGDLPNFRVDEFGYAWAEFFTSLASLDGSVGAHILDEDGAAIVIHENPDDHMSQPIGGAGDRIACGVIEASD